MSFKVSNKETEEYLKNKAMSESEKLSQSSEENDKLEQFCWLADAICKSELL